MCDGGSASSTFASGGNNVVPGFRFICLFGKRRRCAVFTSDSIVGGDVCQSVGTSVANSDNDSAIFSGLAI